MKAVTSVAAFLMVLIQSTIRTCAGPVKIGSAKEA